MLFGDGIDKLRDLVDERRGAVADEAVETMADCDASELLGADVSGAEERELSWVKGRVGHEEVVAYGEAQNDVAKELEALVGDSIDD